MPLRGDVHGNWVAQSGNGDEMDDGAENKGGPGRRLSMGWF